MDAVALERVVERVAPDRIIGADQDREIGVVGRAVPGEVQAANAGNALQSLPVGRVDRLPPRQHRADVPKLDEAERRIQLAHLPVQARFDHRRFVFEAEVLELVDPVLHRLIGADDGAALEGVEHLGGVEAQDRQVAVVQHALPAMAHAEGVGGVVDHLKPMSGGDARDRLDVAGLAVAMDRQDRAGARGDRGFDPGGIEVEGHRVDVDEDGGEPAPEQGVRGRDEGIGRRDHLAREVERP